MTPQIAMEPCPLNPPPEEDVVCSTERITQAQKKIIYKLQIVQGPERARACGAGQKSSADRRPVDPPPVVRLNVFECEPNETIERATDITCSSYNTDFFLYASLESVRPIAHGRGAPPQTIPVLTGVPVAGAAYLDNPQVGGYFIFPDLSARHEGRYCLKFHLYEQVKDPKDADKDAPMPLANTTPSSPRSKSKAPQSFLHFRLEARSNVFTVFSAKRFPGLAPSTDLSRVIALQGCRVRIRREIRLRKRDKSDPYLDESIHPRPEKYCTPDYSETLERSRSASTGTTVDPSSVYNATPRRPSGSDYGYQYPQSYHRPVVPALPSLASQPPGPYPFAMQGAASQFPPLTQPATMYSPQTAPYPLRQPSGAEYDARTSYPYPQGMPMDRRVYSKPELPPLKPLNGQHYDNPMYQSAPRSESPFMSSPAMTSPSDIRSVLPPPPLPRASELSAERKRLYETENVLSKRSHEDSFGADDRPLHNGRRPDSAYTMAYPSATRDESTRELEMEYRRANGRTSRRWGYGLNAPMQNQRC